MRPFPVSQNLISENLCSVLVKNTIRERLLIFTWTKPGGPAFPLGVMTLVKYVYIAHGWTLAYTGRPLIKHQVEAWRGGPMIPEVYHAFSWQKIFVTEKAQGYHPEFGELPIYTTKLNAEEQDIVDKVFDRYSRFDAFQLGDLTKKAGTPWDQFKERTYGRIPNKVIAQHYKKMLT